MKKGLFGLSLIPFLFLWGVQASAVDKDERLWQDETIYHISIDRFNNADNENDHTVDVRDENAYNGGDFQGVTDKLDYIKDMGFTAITLSPVFDNGKDGFDGHDVKDFYKTEEHFGSMKDLQKLVDEAHARDMKIILEFVADEVSDEHPWTEEEDKADWLKGGTKINHESGASGYLLDAVEWWIDETDIDGYYVGHLEEVPLDFWKAFVDRSKSKKEDFFLIGKTAENESTDSYIEIGFDSIVHGAATGPLREAFADSNRGAEEVLELYSGSDKSKQLLTVLDDADTTRFTRDMVHENQNPGTRWKLALTYAYTAPGIPSVFYGSEIAIDGGESPDNQRFMGFKADPELIEFITQLGELRQQLPALTRGDFEVMHSQDDLTVFKRTYENETIVIAINNSDKQQSFAIPEALLEEGKELRGLQAGDLVREDDGKYQLVMGRESTEIYALADKTGINFGYLSAVAAVWVAFSIFIILVMRRSKRKGNE